VISSLVSFQANFLIDPFNNLAAKGCG
ncbi:uncharacterized protein METZ01_LOCUS355213, partial [marine metagenome]